MYSPQVKTKFILGHCNVPMVKYILQMYSHRQHTLCITESWLGVPYGIYGTRGEIKLLIQHSALPRAVSGNETSP